MAQRTEATVVSMPDPTAGNYGHPSDKLWSVYVSEAEKYDKARIDTWKQDMDSLLIFVRLLTTFSLA
jgi:hypothetical protein